MIHSKSQGGTQVSAPPHLPVSYTIATEDNSPANLATADVILVPVVLEGGKFSSFLGLRFPQCGISTSECIAPSRTQRRGESAGSPSCAPWQLDLACELQMYPLKQVNRWKGRHPERFLNVGTGRWEAAPSSPELFIQSWMQASAGSAKKSCFVNYWAVTEFDKSLVHFLTH